MSPKNIFIHNTRTDGHKISKQNTNELLYNNKLSRTIIKKVTKEKHNHSSPKVGEDETLRECKKLFKKGANPNELIKLEKSLSDELSKEREEYKKYHEYYIQCFLPALKEEIKQSKELHQEKAKEIERIISEIIGKSSNRDLSPQSRRGSIESEESEPESGYVSDAGDDSEKDSISNESISDTTISEYQELEISETGKSENKSSNSSEVGDDHIDKKSPVFNERISHATSEGQKVETNNRTTSNAQLLEAIKNGNKKEFKECLKDCTGISGVKDEKGNNILHLIASLRKGQKCDFLDTLVESFKKDLVQLVSGKNQDGKTPFQMALINKIKKREHKSNTIQDDDNTLKFLVKLLEHGAGHDQLKLSEGELQDLNEGQKTYYYNFLETLLGLKPEIEAKEAIAHTVNTPDSNGNYSLHLAVKNNDKKHFKELLQKNADITAEDGNGNNVLHHIASLEGEQKVIFLDLILNLAERKAISEEKLREAVNAANKEGRTPLQVALVKKAKKGQPLKKKTILSPKKNCNTTKFCAALLQKGANADFLWLKNEEYHTDKYYLVLRDLKDYSKTPHKAQEKARKTKEQLEEIYKIKTRSKKFQHTAQKVGSSTKRAASTTGKALSSVGRYIDPARRTRQLLAIAVPLAVAAIAACAFFQGQMAAAVAISIIAVAGVTCLAFTLGFSRTKKLFEKSTNKEHPRDLKSEMKNTTNGVMKVADTDIQKKGGCHA